MQRKVFLVATLLSMLFAIGAEAQNPPDTSTDQGALDVEILDLPPTALANVYVSEPNGKRVPVKRSSLIQGPAGKYTVTADPVTDGADSYYVPHQRGIDVEVKPGEMEMDVEVKPGEIKEVTVDYYDQIPNTTKVIAAGDVISVTPDETGKTFRIVLKARDAVPLRQGDILASSWIGNGFEGLLMKIMRANRDGDRVYAYGTQARLAEAIERGSLTYEYDGEELAWQGGAETMHRPQAFPEGAMERVAYSFGPKRPPAPCQFHAGALGCFYGYGVDANKKFTKEGGSVTSQLQGSLSGEFEVRPQLSMHVKWGFFKLKSADVMATVSEHLKVTARGEASLKADDEKDLGSYRQEPAAVVFVGDVPVVIQAQITPFVAGEFDSDASIYSELTEDAWLRTGVGYQNGKTYSVGPDITPTYTKQLSFDGEVSGKVSVGLKIGALVYGSLFPNIQPEVYLKGSYGSEQEVLWGVEGKASLDAEILGTDHSLATPSLSLYKHTIWKGERAPVPSLTSVSPSFAASGGHSSVHIVLMGSGFSPDSVARMDGSNLATVFTSPQEITAVIPSSRLTSHGTHHLTVKTPGGLGDVSKSIDFSVR